MPPSQEQARQKIRHLVDKYRKLNDTERRLMSESAVVHQFLDPFFEALGWPVGDPARYKYELSTQAGRPDMILTPAQGGAIFVEAKRFGKIEELAQARKTIAGIVTPGQLALPGMATDRTAEEQQAINYAFQNNGEWAILTNFEKLRLFNARRDWLVLSFEQPAAFLDEFDLLWQLAYENILAGELERLSSQRHREDVDSDYLRFINDWRQRLAQDILARPADNWWAYDESGRLNLANLRAVVQRLLDRLVVIRFAEDHLVIPPGTLYDFYDLRRRNPYTFSLSQFMQRLFRRFDEDHNSALFAPDLADGASLSDAALSDLIQKLYEARYRAMPPDIMGNTYEQYLGKALNLDARGQITTADNLETRKKQGSYYTPQVIVRYLVDNSLGRYLYGTEDGKPTPTPGPSPVAGEGREAESPSSVAGEGLGVGVKTAADIRHLRVLDPSCGSGSFLIYAYEVLADFYRREIKRLEQERAQRLQELIAQGVTTPFDLEIQLAPYRAELERLQDYPRLIVETHLYGVDLDPQAAEIATVNLMMRAMADQPRHKKRLPLILNQNIKVGNALIGDVGATLVVAQGGDVGATLVVAQGGDVGATLVVAQGGDVGATLVVAQGGDVGATLVVAQGGDVGATLAVAQGEDVGATLAVAQGGDVGATLVVAQGGDVGATLAVAQGGDVGATLVVAQGGDVGATLAVAQGGDVGATLVVAQGGDVGATLAVAQGGDKPHPYAEMLAELRRLRQNLAVGANDHAPLQAIEHLAGPLLAALNDRLAPLLADPAAYRPFHWPVEFPEVFLPNTDLSGFQNLTGLSNEGGFDLIIGNPPWEIIKPDLREFYAQFDPDIESKLTRSGVEQRIEELNRFDPAISASWAGQKAKIEAEAAYFQRAPDFTRQGKGDTATHKLFLERAYRLLKPGGRLGFVIPSGIYTDLGTKELREMLLNEGRIEYLYSFSNERFFFPFVHHSFKFVLLGVQKGAQSDGFWATFRFNPRVAVAPDELTTFLANPDNLIYMRRELLEKFSPDSLSLMEFQSRHELEIAVKIYDDWPLIGDELEGQWNIRLNLEFHMTNDRRLFNQKGLGYPLYEGKMIHQFDAFHAEPQFWVSEENATLHFRTKKSESSPLDYLIPRLGFREIARATDSRTLIATILPPGVCCNHKISVVSPRLSTYKLDEMLYTLAILNSFVLDFAVRFKVATGVSMFHFYQLPLPRLTAENPYFEAIVARAAALTCTRPEFAGLWQEVMGSEWPNPDLSGASRNLTGLIPARDPAERQTLRDELDALVAHLYGLSRAEFEHILGTFPLVFPPTPEGQAKKSTLLAGYDRLAGEVKAWARR